MGRAQLDHPPDLQHGATEPWRSPSRRRRRRVWWPRANVTAEGLRRGGSPYTAGMARPTGTKQIVENRRARHDYQLLDRLEAGIVLTGTEVKSLREGQATLAQAYADVRGNEVWLIGADIATYGQGNIANHEPARDRKLLLHRARDRVAHRQGEGARPDARPDAALLQGRQGEGRARAREGQGEGRQAARHRRARGEAADRASGQGPAIVRRTNTTPGSST